MYNNDMISFTNVLNIVIGFCLVGFNKQIANSMIEFYFRTTGIRYRMVQFRFPMYLVGIGFLIGGILGFFQIINFN
jgi:hypothetical protein